MERREVLGSIGALVAAALAGEATAQSSKTTPAKAPAAATGGHQHHGTSASTELLIDAINECVNKGEACMAHCLVLLGEGDKSVAGCAKSVNETLALCEGLRKVAAQGSPRAKVLARIVADACKDCEKECRKHETKHAECRDCAKACAACARECQSFMSS